MEAGLRTTTSKDWDMMPISMVKVLERNGKGIVLCVVPLSSFPFPSVVYWLGMSGWSLIVVVSIPFSLLWPSY